MIVLVSSIVLVIVDSSMYVVFNNCTKNVAATKSLRVVLVASSYILLSISIQHLKLYTSERRLYA